MKLILVYFNDLDTHEPENKDQSKCHLDYILDITIAYPNGEPLDLPTIVTGNRDPFQTHFLYRLYPTSQVFLKGHINHLVIKLLFPSQKFENV